MTVRFKTGSPDDIAALQKEVDWIIDKTNKIFIGKRLDAIIMASIAAMMTCAKSSSLSHLEIQKLMVETWNKLEAKHRG